MSDFKKGNLVEVIDPGELYSTYTEWADKYGATGYEKLRGVVKGNHYTVVCIHKHFDTPRLLALIENGIKQQFIIGTAGIKLVSKELQITKTDHGRKVIATLGTTKITDAKLSIDGDGNVFVCQNEVDGGVAENKLGYKYSWMLTGDLSRGVKLPDGHDYTDFKFVNKGETKMGRQTFRLLKDTPELKKGALVQEACDDGDQEYKLLENQDKFVKHDDLEDYDIDLCFSRKTVETGNFFEEVFPVEPQFMNAEELTRHKEFMAKKPVKKVDKTGVKKAVKAKK